MRRETSEWSIRMLADFESRINVEAEYQRGKVWSQPQQALLIDSILRGFDIPKIFLRKRPDGSSYLFDVIDGKQRLTAIWRFVSNDFRLLRNVGSFPDLGNLGGKCWSELPNDAKDRLQFTNISVSKIEDATEDEIHELFLRLQRGEPLNAAERRNAMSGPIRDFVANKLINHPVWSKTGLRPTRFGLHEHAAIVLALVSNNGPTGLKGADLQQLYEDVDFDPDGEDACRTIRLLYTMKEIAELRLGYIRTRWGLVDLFIVLMRLEDDDRVVKSETIMNFFHKFEEERRSVGGKFSDLQTKLVELSVVGDLSSEEIRIELPEISSYMLSYYLAFSREGASEENVVTRSTIMYQGLLDFEKSESVT